NYIVTYDNKNKAVVWWTLDKEIEKIEVEKKTLYEKIEEFEHEKKILDKSIEKLVEKKNKDFIFNIMIYKQNKESFKISINKIDNILKLCVSDQMKIAYISSYPRHINIIDMSDLSKETKLRLDFKMD
ncbi:11945_t:CDS:2, partial [Funneliformis mosseae]